jgi:polyisoprenoid-binding protein YceI
MMKFFTTLLLLAMPLVAKEATITRTSFEDAKKQQEFLKFIGTSTKLKFFSSTFEGFAKKYSVKSTMSEDKKSKNLTELVVTITASELDTDNSSRNEKMQSLCLDSAHFPTITAKLKQPVSLSETSGMAFIDLTVKSKTIEVKAPYTIRIEKGVTLIDFHTTFSVKEAGITDPSIAIARLEDAIELAGVVEL